MATQPIDLSAGLIPKQSAPQASSDQGIDLSAGFVPRPSVPQSMLRNQWENLKATGKEVGSDLGKGVAEGAGQTVGTVSTLINKIPYVGETLAPSQGVKALQQMSTPEDTSQKVGAGLEQAGEMALTGGPMRAGAEALATKIPSIAKYLAPALRIAAESANTGGSAALHGEPVGPAALTGGSGQAVTEAMPYLAPFLRKAAQNQYSQALAPTTVRNKNITKQIVPGLLERGEVNTQAGLASKADSQVDQLGSQINAAVSKINTQPIGAGSTIPLHRSPKPQNVIDDLEDYKNQFKVNGIPVDPDAVDKATQLQGIIKQLGSNVSYQDLNKVRQIWDEKVANAGGFAGRTLQEGSNLDAQREGASAIRAELAKASPDIQKINQQFHFWKNVSDVIDDTNTRKVGQFGGLGKLVAPLAGFAGGTAHGGLAQGAEYSAALLLAHQVMRSTAYRTTSAVLKNKLADALMSGSSKAVGQVATEIGAGVGGQLSKSQPQEGQPVATSQ